MSVLRILACIGALLVCAGSCVAQGGGIIVEPTRNAPPARTSEVGDPPELRHEEEREDIAGGSTVSERPYTLTGIDWQLESIRADILALSSKMDRVESSINPVDFLILHGEYQFVIDGFKRAASAEFDRKVNRTRNERDVLQLTYFESLASAIVAHLMLIVGVGAALTEFRAANKSRGASRERLHALTSDASAAPAAATEAEISINKLALKTSLNGVVLFACTLGFYFMYVRYVFPIQYLSAQETAVAGGAAADIAPDSESDTTE